jgi:hypothetical protein
MVLCLVEPLMQRLETMLPCYKKPVPGTTLVRCGTPGVWASLGTLLRRSLSEHSAGSRWL